MIEFQPMRNILPPIKVGIAEVRHREITKDEATFAQIRAMQHPEEWVEAGTYTQLRVNDYLVMTDTHMEKQSNFDFLMAVEKRGGDILVGGLGLGMILVPIFKLPQVRSITVVEKHQDVVSAVWPMLAAKFGYPQCPQVGPRRCTVITADINEWTPPIDCRWDVIYFDIWPDICDDFLKEILALKSRFKSFLKRGGWMKGWQENRYRRNQRGW